MWQFYIYQDWNTVFTAEHVNHWENLLKESPNSHVFFHPTLVKSWIKTYLPIRDMSPIFINGIEKNSKNEVFLPLVLWNRGWKHFGVRSIIPIGYSDYDYHDPILKKTPTDINSFWDELMNKLASIKADNIIIDGIRNNLAIKKAEWQTKDLCPYLDLSNIKNEEQLTMFFKTSLRGDIRRQIRRLNELGPLSLKEYKSVDEAQETFNVFMNEHSLRWPKAYKAPLFHQNMLSEGLASVVHFSSLNIGNEPIAWHLGFEYNGIYYYYMPVGDHNYSKYSPTKIHLFYLMVRAVDKGLKKFDHLRGDENYKSGFSNGVDNVNSLIIKNDSFNSTIKIMADSYSHNFISKLR